MCYGELLNILSRGHFNHESIGILFTRERISQPSRGLPRVSSAAPSQASLPCEATWCNKHAVRCDILFPGFGSPATLPPFSRETRDELVIHSVSLSFSKEVIQSIL